MGDRLPLFKFSGNSKSLKKDSRLYYESCMNMNCAKKLTSEGDGQYRCEKCCQIFNSFKPRFIFTACVQDGSGQLWVTFNDQSAEAIIGMTAEEYVKKEAKEGFEMNPEAKEEFLDSLLFKNVSIFGFTDTFKSDKYTGTWHYYDDQANAKGPVTEFYKRTNATCFGGIDGVVKTADFSDWATKPKHNFTNEWYIFKKLKANGNLAQFP